MKKLLLRALSVMGAMLVLLVAVVLVQGWASFGARATGERRARMERSPQYKDGAFHNPQPLVNHVVETFTAMLGASPHVSPEQALVPVKTDPAQLAKVPASGLRITWLGHASNLVELDGVRVLTDPVWSDRPSPLTWVGPRRWYDPPIALKDLPPLDAVVVSHDHYDHCDMATLQALADKATVFIVPLGVDAHLASWGIPEAKIHAVDWWDVVPLRDGVQVTATPARHASGRAAWDKDATLWAGYALQGPAHRVYFSGDTGLFPAMKDIGEKLGPFDVTMIETGQYHSAWPDWHIGPEQAVDAHVLVKGRVMLPVHWGLLALAFHGWTEPVERVRAAAERRGVKIMTPRPGEPVEPDGALPVAQWWPDVPWVHGEDDPIVSTQVN